MLRHLLLPALLLLPAAPPAARAQSGERPEFAIGLDVVNVTVTARDEKGDLVTDLRREDFVLLDDGEPRRIELFGRAHDPGEDDTMALDLGLLMDTSESMLEVLKLSQHAATRFLDTIPRARELLTIFFDQDIRISRYDSENQQGLYSRIHGLKGGGNTALYDAITVYLSRIQGTRGRKVMVVFSDGEDSISSVRLPEVLQLVRSSPVTIYPIAFRTSRPGSMRGMRSLAVLGELAELSGGQVHMPMGASDLGGIYDGILEELAAQYVIGFTPEPMDGEGRFRKLKVEVPGRSDLKLRCREGYYPPGSHFD